MRLRTIIAATAATLAVHTTPGAADSKLPAVGDTASFYESGSVTIHCGGHEYNVDLAGTGTLLVGVPLVTVDAVPIVPITTTDEELTGHSAEFGDVKVTEAGPTTGELIEQDALHVFPARATMPMNLRIAVKNNPCQTANSLSAPAEFTTSSPARLLTSDMKQFPPLGDSYNLQEPVNLGDSTGKTIGTLNGFPVNVSAL